MVAVAQVDNTPANWAGRPLWTSVAFVGLPIFLVVFVSAGLEMEIQGGLLFAIGGFLGLLVLVSTVYNVEWLLAALVMYLPLSRVVPAIVVPGLNGVNILLVLVLVAWASAAQGGKCSFIKGIPYGRVMFWFGVLSCLSVLTVMRDPIGEDFFMYEGKTEFKGWLDQFVLFFGFANLISGRAMAKRIVIYCVIGSVIAESLGILEMIQNQGASSIENARVYGPVQQPNNFGAFIVYNLSPIIAFAVLNYRKWYVVLVIPYLFVSVKLLLATFSRGAYLGLAMAGITATFFRGLIFFALAAGVGIGILVKYPGLIPEAVTDRMGSTTGGYYSTTYDESANSRLVLWEAGVEMTAESPILGKGFLAFQLLKSQYTDVPVEESDPHNMYLYICSQMGIPALLLFLWMLFGFFHCSLRVYRNADDEFSRVIGLGGLTMIAGVVTINMFGTRMINSEVSGYFWIYFAVLVNLLREPSAADTKRAAPGIEKALQDSRDASTNRPRKTQATGSVGKSASRRRFSVIP